MKRITILGLFLSMVMLVTFTAFARGGQEETGAEGAWSSMIDWNKPVPWAERLKGLELAPKMPQEFINVEPWLKDPPVNPNKTVAVGGYVWPEGWEEAIEGVDSLTFFNYGGLPHDPAIGIAIAAYEIKTGIDINAQAMEELGLWLKTVAAMTARRSEPQLIHFGGLMYLNHVAAAGWAANLDFFWPEEVQALYGEGFVNAAQSQGHFWSSGMVATKPFVLFYRPSVLQKVTGSAAPPKNYQELLEKAKMVAQQTDMYGVSLPGKDHRYMWYINSGPLYSMGGKFTTNGQYDVTSPEYRTMFTYMANLVKEGAAPEECFGWSWTDMTETFERGRSAFLMAGTVNATRFEDQKPEAIAGDWDFVPAPGWEDKPGMSTIDGTAYWAINTYAKDNEKAAAALFLDLYRSYQGMWNEIGFEGNESPIPAMYDMDSIKKAVFKPETRADAIAKTGGESLPINGDQMLKYEHEWWTKAASGEVSVDEALENLAKDIQSIAP